MIELANENTKSVIDEQLNSDLKYVKSCLNKLKIFDQKIFEYVNTFTSTDIENNSNNKTLYKNFFNSNDMLKESVKLKKSLKDLKDKIYSLLKINNFEKSSSIKKVDLYNSKVEETSKIFLNFEKKAQKYIKTLKNTNNSEYKKLTENTLIISEKDKKIILPYSISEIKHILKEDTNEFSLPEEVVEELYTIPMKKYKNSALSRFKESYKIVRERSNGSRKEALDLALELLPNYKLHPAIITACKNVYELDIYLSCLEYNELEDFRFFNIVYEIPSK